MATNQPAIFGRYDFGVWRDELESVEEVGVFSPFQPNLILEDGHSASIPGSRITSAAFGNAVGHVLALASGGRPGSGLSGGSGVGSQSQGWNQEPMSDPARTLRRIGGPSPS